MSKFAEYATGSAFRIDLSKNMVRALSSLDWGDSLFCEKFMTLSALQCRGLVELKQGEGWYLTEAGERVVELIKLAGVYETREQFCARHGVEVAA